MDKRIGRFTDTGREYPETTISGAAPYRKPCSIVFLGNSYFAVLDTFMDNETANNLILELQEIVRAELKPKAKAKSDETE